MKKVTWRIFKKNGLVVNSMAAAAIALAATSSLADPLPTGGAYVSGTGTIGSAGNTMTINQSSTNGIINWGSFSIDSGNTVDIQNGTGATLNRVIGSNPSAIYGQLKATGSAYLINQNGIVIGPSGQVNTGGTFVASTRDISNDDFNDGGTNTFEGTSNAGVVNQGVVTAGGHAIIIGQTVENTGTGTIKSTGGDVMLGGGNKVLLTETNAAGQRMFVEVAGGSVSNSGIVEGINAELKANGGNIYALAINNTGTVRANGLETVGGKVILAADNDVNASGQILATDAVFPYGTNKSGVVNISGKNVSMNNTLVDTGRNGSLTVNAANGNWRSGTGAVKFNGDITIASDYVTVNSGKTETGARTDMLRNVKLRKSDDAFGTISINGFENVDLNFQEARSAGCEVPVFGYGCDPYIIFVDNGKLVTDGSVVVNAANIFINEHMQVGGDFVLNAAAFDDITNNFVPQAGKGANTLFSDGWKTNHGTLNFEGVSTQQGDDLVSVVPSELDICCGVTVTSGLDEDENRVDLTSANAVFGYNITPNHTTKDYKWFEAKGFDVFNTQFEDGRLAVNDSNNPANNGFVKLINNTNYINNDTIATNNIDIISFNDTFISGVDVDAGKDLTIVVDEANPTSSGDGKLVVDADATLEGNTIGIYTSKQANNDIQGTINGQTFTEGTEFADTSIEKWLVFFSTRGAADGNKNPFKVYYKNQAPIVIGRPDCSANPNQSGCENFVAFTETGKEYRVALAQDSTAPEEGALAWGNSSQVRANEFYTIKAYDYVDTNLTTSEKLSTFWYALPIQLVNIPLDGISKVPGIQAIAEGIKGLTGGVESGLNSVVR